MEREAHSRLDSMQRFFEECARDPASCAQNYGPEVLRRTITQEILLAMEIDDIHSAELDDKVKVVDRKLRVQVKESDFVWDEQLEAGLSEGDLLVDVHESARLTEAYRRTTHASQVKKEQ